MIHGTLIGSESTGLPSIWDSKILMELTDEAIQSSNTCADGTKLTKETCMLKISFSVQHHEIII